MKTDARVMMGVPLGLPLNPSTRAAEPALPSRKHSALSANSAVREVASERAL